MPARTATNKRGQPREQVCELNPSIGKLAAVKPETGSWEPFVPQPIGEGQADRARLLRDLAQEILELAAGGAFWSEIRDRISRPIWDAAADLQATHHETTVYGWNDGCHDMARYEHYWEAAALPESPQESRRAMAAAWHLLWHWFFETRCCRTCGKELDWQRSTKQFCSDRHRAAWTNRMRKVVYSAMANTE